MSSKLLNYPSATSTTSAHSRFVNNSSSAVTSNAIASSCSFNYDNLRLDEILCPVCSSVLVEPVYLPCQHLFCRNCLSETIEKNKLNCPCCRKRFGTWYRNASRVNKLVHERLWQAIQSQFRDHLAEEGVLGSTKGSTNGTAQLEKSCYMPPTKQNITLANQGEIRKEFTDELKRFQKERLVEATKELAATEQCILKLYKQEGIIDLGDNSSHVSVSSTTSPDLNDGAGFEKTATVSTSSPMAGPSSLCNTRRQAPEKGQSWNQLPIVTIGSKNSKSPSNGSVISISSTSSAQSAVTASSCASSSASERYSLLKSVVQHVGRSAELVKQKVQGTILHRLTAGKLQQHQKSLGTFDLNKSEHCVKPTPLHKVEQRGAVKEEEGVDDGTMNDTDSLKSEQNHFIPIIASLPKSSFSLDAVTRAIPVRPAVTPLKYHYTPKKSPYRPLKATGLHRSAFSVVNLFTPPKISPVDSEKSIAKSKRNDKTPTSTPRRGRRRRTKLKFTAPRARKTATRNQLDPAGPTGCGNTSTRTTRRTAEAQAIRDLIISDQQRREQQIEMERRDFEFAQRLQEKLNRTGGIMQEIHRQYPAPRSTGYSLRRKGTLNETVNGSCIENGTSLNQAAPSTPQESGGSQKNTPAKNSRKRKATSSSVENDVPSSSSPAKQLADHSAPRQTRQNRTSKLNNASLPSGTASANAAKQPPVPQRKSTRNKAR
uniref:RING-type E3 ubiquitin transferase n=1 Tax=Anopheles atroparvus TaxID=41427 RepID=A0A182J1B8_ANOAO